MVAMPPPDCALRLRLMAKGKAMEKSFASLPGRDSCSPVPRTGCARIFTMFTVTELVGGNVGEGFEHLRKGRLGFCLRVGGGFLVAFPRQGEALGVEARQ